MERSRWAVLTAGVALAIAGANATATFAQTAKPGHAQPSGQTTQKPAPQDDTQSMARPPESASGPSGPNGPSGSSNPDNMPIKRPSTPTNDRMMHAPPASGANAK